jgi:hypothetical protein
MKTAINAGILDDRLSGLGVYTTNVTSSLAGLKDVDISIYTAKPEAPSVINGASAHLIPSIVQPKYGKVAGLARFIWNQTVFPFWWPSAISSTAPLITASCGDTRGKSQLCMICCRSSFLINTACKPPTTGTFCRYYNNYSAVGNIGDTWRHEE